MSIYLIASILFVLSLVSISTARSLVALCLAFSSRSRSSLRLWYSGLFLSRSRRANNPASFSLRATISVWNVTAAFSLLSLSSKETCFDGESCGLLARQRMGVIGLPSTSKRKWDMYVVRARIMQYRWQDLTCLEIHRWQCFTCKLHGIKQRWKSWKDSY